MTAPLLTTRDRLAEAIHDSPVACVHWTPTQAPYCERIADALLASGAVVDVATLAEDEALVERVAAREALSSADGPIWEQRCWELQQHLAALADELGSDG